MNSKNGKINVLRVAFVSLLISFCLSVFVSTIKTYTHNYKASDGFTLPGGQPIGGDFICFYTAGHQYREDKDNLYDFQTQFTKQKEVFKRKDVELGLIPFVYPPLMAMLFSLLSPFSLLTAYIIWSLFSASLYIGGLCLLIKHLHLRLLGKAAVFLVAISFVPFSIDCLAGGQTSNIGFFAYALMFVFLKSGRDSLAGATLAFSYYKPHLFVGFVVLIILRKRWKVFISFMIISLLFVFASYLSIGSDAFTEYLRRAASHHYGNEIVPGYKLVVGKGVSLLPFLHQLFPGRVTLVNILYACTSLLLIALVFIASRKCERAGRNSMLFDLVFALDVAISLFLAPYMMVYDLTILVVPLLIVCSTVLARKMHRYGIAILCVAAGFMLEFLMRTVRLTFATFQTPAALLLVWIVCLVLFFWREVKLDAYENNA